MLAAIVHLLSALLSLRALPVVAAAETHGGAAERGQRHGRVFRQQCSEPTQLGILRVHRHDPGGE